MATTNDDSIETKLQRVKELNAALAGDLRAAVRVCEEAKKFLELIGYQTWGSSVIRVIAMYNEDNECSCGTSNFDKLNQAVQNYFGTREQKEPEPFVIDLGTWSVNKQRYRFYDGQLQYQDQTGWLMFSGSKTRLEYEYRAFNCWIANRLRQIDLGRTYLYLGEWEGKNYRLHWHYDGYCLQQAGNRYVWVEACQLEVACNELLLWVIDKLLQKHAKDAAKK